MCFYKAAQESECPQVKYIYIKKGEKDADFGNPGTFLFN